MALFPDAVHPDAAELGLPAREQQRRPDRGPPARLHLPGLRHLLAHRLRRAHVARRRPHRDDHRGRRSASSSERFAGFYGGWLDSVLSRIGDIFFSIPYILAAVVVMSVLSQYRNVCHPRPRHRRLRVGRDGARLRAEVLRVRNADFVTASRHSASAVPHPAARTSCRTRSRRCSSSRRSASRPRSSPRRRCRSSVSGSAATIMSWGNDISQAQTSLRVAPHGAHLAVDRAVRHGARVHHAGRAHPRRPRPEGEGSPMTFNAHGAETPLLSIRDLKVAFDTQNGSSRSLHGVSIDVSPRARPSRSWASRAPASRRPRHADHRPAAGHRTRHRRQILLDGRDLTTLSSRQMEAVRGREIGYVPQDPMSNLNPVWSIGFQVEGGHPGQRHRHGPRRTCTRAPSRC